MQMAMGLGRFAEREEMSRGWSSRLGCDVPTPPGRLSS
jgi:hypothetical protein